MNFEIGVVSVIYNEDGEVVSASFEPNKKVEFDNTVLTQMVKLKTSSAEEVRTHTDFVLGAWFSKMTNIELADPSLYKIESEVVSCDKFPSGNVQKCVIRYLSKPL